MGTLYKVQSGAYKNVVNATLAARSVRKKVEKYLKATGRKETVSVAVISSGGWHKVQEGAFASKANAEKRKDLLRKAGVYAVVIETKTQDAQEAKDDGQKTEKPHRARCPDRLRNGQIVRKHH